MSPTFEILKVVASNAYIADPTVIHEVAGILAKTPGCLAQWHGLELQDPKHLWLIVAWETLEHHQALINDKQQYPILLAALGKASKELLFLYHVQFSSDLHKSLDAPVTGLTIWSLNASTNRAQFQDGLAKHVAGLLEEIPSDEVFGGGWGAIIEDERKYFVSLGWHSFERFNTASTAAAQGTAQRNALKQLGDIDLKLAKLTKYSV